MTTATKSDFFNAPKVRRVPVPVPALGKTVYVQSMTVREKTEWEESFENKKGGRNKERTRRIRAYMVIATCVDEHGNHLFSGEDVERLMDLDVGLIEPIVDTAKEVLNSSDEDIDALAKNSEETDAGETCTA